MQVYNLSLNPEANALDQWDSGMVIGLLDQLGATYSRNIDVAERGVVILPARHHKGLERAVNAELKKIDKPVLILLGDEEADFDVEQIELDPSFIWIQNPHPDKHDKYNRLGTGYPPHIKREFKTKDIDVFFSGQVTHDRRRQLVDTLQPIASDTWHINRTRGFTQGYEPSQYYDYMNRAKIVPCPSGAVIPDSFRAFEALECFCIPLLDEVSPDGKINGDYWDWLLGANPLPKYKEPTELPAKINELLADWDNISQQCFSWYIRYKNDIKRRIYEQYNR